MKSSSYFHRCHASSSAHDRSVTTGGAACRAGALARGTGRESWGLAQDDLLLRGGQAHARRAGLTLERTAELLRASPGGRELCVSGPKISALENGRQVSGRHWKEPEATGRLLAPLARAYGVPARMVLDAWMRTRPDEPAPVPA